MRILRTSTLALMLSGCAIAALSSQAFGQVSVSISVNIAPPPLPIYEQPPLPAEGFIWVPGYWSWDKSQADFYWVPGTWAQAPQPELLWTPGYWGSNNGSYVFYAGYWGAQVGFYGGIDYGFGYTGDGYRGGRWDHGAFFYNQSVNNIGTVTVKNVYKETITINDTTTHVSYNGGNGGVEARPTAEQQAAAKEHHVEATAAQTQHAEAASKNRALFAKENHGEPAIAATSRPGEFEGKGVVAAKHEANKNGEPPKAAPSGEPAKAEPAKPEPKAEPNKAEPAKPEQKAEPAKPEPKAAAPKPEPKAEAPKPEPKAEAPKPEPKAEAPKPEPKAEAPKANPKAEAPNPEPKAEAPKSEPKAEAPKAEPKAEAPKAEPAKPAPKQTP